MSDKAEKPATRPHWIDESEWNNADVLSERRKALQKKIQARGEDRFTIEEYIADSGQLSKRMRELNPPLVIPVERDDKGVRMHAPEVHQRALRMAETARNHSAHAATTNDTGHLDRAALAVRRHAHGVAAAMASRVATETKES